MKPKFYTLVLPAVMAFIFASCATMKVSTDYDQSKDFRTMKTFAIHENSSSNQTISTLNEERIINAVKAELKSKGYTESTTPDFMVNIVTVVVDKKAVSANTDYYGYGGPYRPYGYWGGGLGMTSTTTFNVDDYKDGSLIIDMVDAKANKLFWEGIGNSEIDSQLKNPDKTIPGAVAKILASFPNAGVQPVVKK